MRITKVPWAPSLCHEPFTKEMPQRRVQSKSLVPDGPIMNPGLATQQLGNLGQVL